MRLNRIRLITAMAERNMRQYALADKIGVSRATVNGVCCGRSCRDDTAQKIADAIGIDLKELVEA